MSSTPDYNTRLFSRGLRSRLHHARFYWLLETARRLFDKPVSVLELGCYDAKTIQFLPYPPVKYSGFDANWENGLDIAREKYDNPAYEFHECHLPSDLDVRGETYNLVICMETLEHLPDEFLEGYLEKLRAASRGVMLITVPNETGLIFLGKFLIKLLVYREKMNPRYGFRDVVNQVFGRLERVVHDDHKGFDYRDLIRTLSSDWDVKSMAIPFNRLPTSLGFSVGLVCTLKARD